MDKFTKKIYDTPRVELISVNAEDIMAMSIEGEGIGSGSSWNDLIG